MPTLETMIASVPRCPTKIGSVPTLVKLCAEPLASEEDEEIGGCWVCPIHERVMTWDDAGRRMRAAMGGISEVVEAA